jgi:hypothetical protein
MMINNEMNMTYNGYDIEAVPANEKPYHFYLYKAQGYMKAGYSLEGKAKRAGRNSDLYKRYIRLLETSNKYSVLAMDNYPFQRATK